MPRAMMLAFTHPVSPEAEAEYNRWYSEKHIHDLLEVEGLISATRYKLHNEIATLPGIGGLGQGYLALYEIEAEDEQGLQRFADNLKAALEDGTADISPNLDLQNIAATFCLPISDRVSNEAAVS